MLKLVGVPALMLGAASWAIGIGCGLKAGLASHIPASFELPLGDPESIALDAEGNVYCALQFYSRVQVYDSEGHYLYGVFVYANGGAFRIRINARDQLEAVTIRHPTLLYVFGKRGTLLRRSAEPPGLFQTFSDKHDYEIYDEKQKALYRIVPALFRPSIVKTDALGGEQTIVQTRLSKGLWKGPFPGWLFLMVGLCALAAADSAFLQNRHPNDR